MAKDAYYFSHDANARNDEKIVFLLYKHGMEAYGLYWIIIEMMHESVDGKLSLKLKDAIAWQYNFAIEKFHNVFNDFFEIDLFVCDGDCYWSERVARNRQERNDKKLHKSHVRSEAGKKGAAAKWQTDGKPMANDSKGMANRWQNMAKGKEIKGKEIKGNKREEELSPSEVDSTVEFISITTQQLLTKDQVKKFYTAFLIHIQDKPFTGRGDQIQHFRTWLKKQDHATTKRDTAKPGTVLSPL